MPKSSSLSLAMRSKPGKDNINSPAVSPRSPESPSTLYPNEGDLATPTAPFHNTPASPASPKLRKDSKSIFANFSATKSSSRIMTPENGSIRQVAEHDASSNLYANGRHGGSTPDLNRPVRTPNSDDNRSLAGPEQRTGSSDQNAEAKRNGAKAKKQGMLSRSKSIKSEERTKLNKQQPPKLSPDATATWTTNGEGPLLKTAPLDKGQSWRQNISFGKLRTHSADRHDGTLHVNRDDDVSSRRDKTEQNSVASGSYNESRGATLMSSLGSGARKMGEKMDSARKGMFGKLGRTSSNHEREPQLPKEPYQFKIIHTPLVEQTRLTRISQRLEHSRDKTEFWMPALPWRCIDYLNMRGCEEEGLYRVPGAAHQIKYYEQKFDQDRDIDLIADENLNDPNVIGSLFKNWLRQLPDEIFPKSIQAQIQQECQGAKTTPQMLKDELSKLPPFNYYLLFAITCHISLLHSCSEFNKMNYNNLCICFQPAIKIDAFCFQFLILDWRNCWQGCWTEKEYLAEEIALLDALENPKPQQPLAQAQTQSQTPSRNGHTAQGSNKSKGSQSSAYLGEALKSSQRSNSTDRNMQATRGISSERSGRATPPNSSLLSSEKSMNSKRETPSDRDSSTDRAVSPERRETYNTRATPKRAPPSVNTEASLDEDNGATPTQLQHSRGPSETQFRLDLSNPPSSPFTIKF